jgi:hypothetical protein
MFETKDIIEEIVKRAPIDQFTKTMRGVKFKNIEFVFSTDRTVEDPCIVAKRVSKKEDVDAGHFIRSEKIRGRLITIFESI